MDAFKETIERVAQALTEAEISHAELLVVSTTNHIVLTDGNSYIKIPEEDSQIASSVEFEAQVLKELGRHEVNLVQAKDGRPVLVTPKLGEPVDVHKVDPALLRDSIHEIAQAQVTDKMRKMLPEPKDWIAKHETLIRQRIAAVKDDILAEDVKELCEDLLDGVEVDDFTSLSFSHGDSGVQNSLVDAGGQIHWVDWENARLAPPQWDACSLLLTMLTRGIDFDCGFDLDDPILQACLRIKIAESASWAAHRLGSEEFDIRYDLACDLGLVHS